MTSIHVVVAEHGRFDDYSHWDVVAYEDVRDAQRHAEAAGIAARTIQETYGESLLAGSEEWFAVMASNALDPNVKWGWVATRYTVATLELRAGAGVYQCLQQGDQRPMPVLPGRLAATFSMCGRAARSAWLTINQKVAHLSYF